MSVKTMLPILGVGSAFAILGLAAARRHQTHHASTNGSLPRAQRPSSGVHPRVALDDVSDADLEAMAPALTSDFWDASPESYSLVGSHGRPANEFESYDAVDTEDLTAEWLARATQAPPDRDFGAFELDDPAEIAADSLSMISDASRHAAAPDPEELDELDERAADSRA